MDRGLRIRITQRTENNMSKNNIITFLFLLCFHSTACACLILCAGIPTTIWGWVFFSLFAVYIVVCACLHGAALNWEEQSYYTVDGVEIKAYNLDQAEKIASRIRRRTA